jgi:hypothetical protein
VEASAHWIVLDRPQADTLWKLDAAWNAEHDSASVFAQVAKDISAYAWDESLSAWNIPVEAVPELCSLLESVRARLDGDMAAAADAVVTELSGVAALIYERAT